MSSFYLLAVAGAAAFVMFITYLGTRKAVSGGNGWIVASALSVAFLLYSLFAVVTEGPLGFWPEHTGNAWEVQIWFDLLLAVGVAVALLVPRARSLQIAPLPWLVLVMATGSIGLLAFTARVLFAEQRETLGIGD